MSPTRPEVTIGVCARNCARSIRETVKSIFYQDFPHELMKVIFVDDGSEDETLIVVKNCVQNADMKTEIFSRQWQGLGSSRNMIVENAEGDYVIWVDGDMVLPKNHVRKQVAYMKQNPGVGIAGGERGISLEKT